MENLNTKSNGDIVSITSFRLGFNASNVLNTSKIKDKKIIYVTVRSDNMYISCQLPKNILRAMLVHGTSAKTAILSIEDTGFWLYGDITGITSINLINNLAGLGLASSYGKHSSSGVTSKHYIAKANPTEIRNSIINARKKLGIF